jgi:leucyl aminopeptidase
MIRVSTSTRPLMAHNTKCYAMFVEQEAPFEGLLAEVAKSHIPGLQQLMVDADITGAAGEKFVRPVATKDGVMSFLCVGIGAKRGTAIDIENFRRAIGTAVKEVSKLKADTLAIAMPKAALFGVEDQYFAQQAVITADMAYYHFDEFITDPKRTFPDDLVLTLVLDGHDEKQIKEGCKRGIAIARGVYFTRHWVDMPPDHSTPLQLAEKAKEIANTHGYTITIFNEQEVNQMGMGGLSAVARGSERDCHLVVIEYKTKKANAPTIGLVGKGITFDSGGLSLKPADYMETMKDDMSGAAAVIGALDALGSLQPDVNIVAVLPLTENLPSGKATMPGDIVTFYNGKTAEILNTDAEGRLILADALAYATKHYKLDAIIDLATLTGACVVALGHFYSGIMSQHDELVSKIEQASKLSGDRVWRLPMDDDFKSAIRSDNADIKNIGSKKYSAGTITASFFLQNFVGDVPWAHLDIAGTAFDVPDISYYRSGATGVGVRLIVELVMNWKQ